MCFICGGVVETAIIVGAAGVIAAKKQRKKKCKCEDGGRLSLSHEVATRKFSEVVEPINDIKE